MNLFPDKSLIDDENPLLKKLTPVVLAIACRGFLKADSKSLVLGAALSVLLSPISWILSIAGKLLHLAILFFVWWLARDQIAALGISEYIALMIIIVAVLYTEIYDDLVDLILNLLVLFTGGRFLRWIAAGYLSGDGARQLLVTGKHMSTIVPVFAGVMPTEYRTQYDQLMDLYLDSARPTSSEKLNELLDEYSRGESRESDN